MTVASGFPKRVFITGTDTNVGKTVISAILMAGTGADYWKPIQSGTAGGTDSESVQSLLGCSAQRIHRERYVLSEPLSPHAAAKIDDQHILLSDFTLPDSGDRHLIVEGAGGVLVPLNEQHLVVDLIERLELPTIVVARSGLGTINHTLLTVRALRANGVQIFGVIMNGTKNQSNREAIEHYGQVPVIGEVEPLASLSLAVLQNVFKQCSLDGTSQATLSV